MKETIQLKAMEEELHINASDQEAIKGRREHSAGGLYMNIDPFQNTAIMESKDEGPLYSTISARLPDLLSTKVTDEVPTLSDRELGPIYSSITPRGEYPHIDKKTDIVVATATSSTGTTRAGMTTVIASDEDYSTVVLSANPIIAKGKLRLKKGKLPSFNVRPPLLRTNSNPTAEDDNMYSTVSNIPKKARTRSLNRAANESPEVFTTLNLVSLHVLS